MLRKLLLCLSITAFVFISSCKSGTNDEVNKTKESNWKTTKLGSLGLSVDAPFAFTESDITNQLTPSVKKLIKKMETFVKDQKNESYSINAVEYQPDATLNLDAAVNGAIREIALKSGGKTSDRNDKKNQIDGNDATITTVTIATENNGDMELQMAIIGKDKKMYQAMGIYKKDNTTAAENTSRIISSIKIN
ncbi:MAG: hypothetical protein IPI78_08960 [Chitinophagaceae bacterium]|nr:hypothetical protein [Chitinophagaceae bacterium]